MFETLFWGGVLRSLQALAQAAPTLLVGLVVAGIFRHLLGPDNTLRLFGGRSWRSLPQAWALGMLLPVCSLGVIPVLREMRRAGISGGTILAFALAAPLFNPLSLLYGLTLSKPLVIVAFAACSLIIVTGVGAVWDWMFPQSEESVERAPVVAHGLKRLTAMAVVGAREMAGATGAYVLLVLVGVILLNVFLPAGNLQTALKHEQPQSPLLMTAVAIPAYVTPMLAISQLGSMFQHGNSPGAAFVLLTLGAGTNLGMLAWTVRSYGLWRSGVWLTLLLTVVLAMAYAVEYPLYPTDIEPAQHTHVFDMYCCPFHVAPEYPGERVLAIWKENLQPYESVCLGLLSGFLLFGVVLRILDHRWRIEDWLERSPADPNAVQPWYNVKVPASVLGATALLGLVVLSIVGCYIYYPPPQEAFAQMRITKTETIGAAFAGQRKQTERWIAEWDDWTRKMQVGVYLRSGRLSEYQQIKARILRDKLELLEHAMAHDDRDEIQRLGMDTLRAYDRMRDSYLPLE